ncbi:MAG: hypothetical protein ISS34_00105 [Candidatus Omnitrophica bacterium]|nr:hypothetical protein [Candidatus Omnitrophota bacterium]
MENVVVWGFAVYYWLHIPFLKELKARENVKIHFICSSPQSVEYWRGLDREGVIDTYVTINHFFNEYDRCQEAAQDIYDKARYYEDRYNVYAVDALQTDRHLGRGFSAAGTGHPRSHLSDKASYIKSVNIFNKIFKFWEDYLDKTKPDLVIGLQVGIIGKIFMAVARHRSIPVRIFNGAKYRSRHYWVVDEYYSSPEVKKNFADIKNIDEFVDEEDLNGPIEESYIKGVYQRFLKKSSKVTLLKEIILQIRSYLYKRYKKVVSMGGYRLSENIKYLYRAHKGSKVMKNLKTASLDELSDKPYIFYPLHTEPEMAVGTFSPEFNEQLAAIEFMAKNLPAGALLAVKEHLLAIGRRPGDFYKTIQDIPNVVMVSPLENALRIAKSSRGVAVITSTLGVEAAISGIPVISFGAHNVFNFLPHVHVVSSWRELRPLLHRLCAGDGRAEAKNRRTQEGLRFLAAIKASSVDFDQKEIGSKEREADILYPSLIESLHKR